MAFATDIHGHKAGIADRITAALTTASEQFARRRLYHRTIRELSALSTRELDDLGLNRATIRRVALEASGLA